MEVAYQVTRDPCSLNGVPSSSLGLRSRLDGAPCSLVRARLSPYKSPFIKRWSPDEGGRTADEGGRGTDQDGRGAFMLAWTSDEAHRTILMRARASLVGE